MWMKWLTLFDSEYYSEPLPSPASSEDDRYKYNQLLIEAKQGKDAGKGSVGKPAGEDASTSMLVPC